MKLISINVEIVRRTGNYESTKIGAEFSIAETEMRDEQSLFNEAIAAVETAYKNNYYSVQPQPAQPQPAQPQPAQPQPAQPQPAQPQPAAGKVEKKVLTFDDPNFQMIVEKIQNGTPIEVVKQYYDFDKKIENVLKLAVNIG